MPVPRLRCLAVGASCTAVLVTLGAGCLPVALSAADGLDGVLVRCAAGLATLVSAWLTLVTDLVVLEAWRGGTGRTRGVPAPVRRALMAACGVAAIAGLATPASAEESAHPDPPIRPAGVVAATLAGLPLPDRAHGPASGIRHPVAVTVRPGDTLWSLAEEHLGAGSRWRDLYAANRSVIGADPDVIRPAQRLRVPRPTDPKEHR